MGELDDFIDELLLVVPAIGTSLESWGYDVRPDLEIPTSWAGSVGATVARLFPGLEVADRARVFAVVERFLASGSQLTQDCVATGFLEALANGVSSGRIDGPALAEVLGPESRAYLDAWDQFTMGRSTLDGSWTPPLPGST